MRKMGGIVICLLAALAGMGEAAPMLSLSFS